MLGLSSSQGHRWQTGLQSLGTSEGHLCTSRVGSEPVCMPRRPLLGAPLGSRYHSYFSSASSKPRSLIWAGGREGTDTRHNLRGVGWCDVTRNSPKAFHLESTPPGQLLPVRCPPQLWAGSSVCPSGSQARDRLRKNRFKDSFSHRQV